MTDTKNTPEREDLPEAVQQRLEKLLKKDPVKLNSSQKGFIKGRSAYLTKQEMSDFSVILIQTQRRSLKRKHRNQKKHQKRQKQKKRRQKMTKILSLITQRWAETSYLQR